MAKKTFKNDGSSVLSPIDKKSRREVFAGDFFDEQIQFKNINDAILKNINYSLTLESGEVLEGVTDSLGKTGRIRTVAAVAITHVELKAKKQLHTCSPQCDHSPGTLSFALNNVKTNSTAVGTSVVIAKTPDGESRPMTAGEINLAKLIFKDSIDYSKVKCHNGEYLWFGMQPDSTAMTPEGEIYFSPKEFRADFSKEPPGSRLWFMHEMVHVWQYQLGYPTKLRGAARLGLSYEYTLRDGKLLSDYNMEAQGDILADYWALVYANGQRPPNFNQKKHINDIELYKRVLNKFILNPSDKSSLPSIF